MEQSSPASLASSGRSVRRRTTVNVRAQQALAQQMAIAQAQRAEEDIQWIVNYLRAHTEQVAPTRVWLEAGGHSAFQRLDEFPRGVRRMSNIPVRDMARGILLIVGVQPGQLDGLIDYDTNVQKLWYYMLRRPKNYPVSVRNRPAFYEEMRLRYVACGSPLNNYPWDPLGTVLDWTYGIGIFRLQATAGVYSTVHNTITGETKDLPLPIPEERRSEFLIEDNEFYDQAKLVGQFTVGIRSTIVLKELGWGDEEAPASSHGGAAASMPPPPLAPSTPTSVAASPATMPSTSPAAATSAAGKPEPAGTGEPDMEAEPGDD